MLALYKEKLSPNKNSKSETLALPVVPNEDATAFWLQVEGIRWPLTQRIDATLMGLTLLCLSLNREELIEAINERCACVHPLEFDEFLDQREGFRDDFNRYFWKVPLPRVREFSEELNRLIALRSETAYEFYGFDLDLPADSMW
jgi:hypothetical protein